MNLTDAHIEVLRRRVTRVQGYEVYFLGQKIWAGYKCFWMTLSAAKSAVTSNIHTWIKDDHFRTAEMFRELGFNDDYHHPHHYRNMRNLRKELREELERRNVIEYREVNYDNNPGR